MKKNINIFNFCFFIILVLTLLNDYLAYFLNLKYLLSISISFILVLILLFIFRKKYKLKLEFTKNDIYFLVMLFAVLVTTIVYPDRDFDTINYHLYLQENPFGDKIFSDFFAGKAINSFSYAFPDRVFYIFRFFLGYRIGVIINYLFMIVIYTNAKKMLKKLNVFNSDDFKTSVFSCFITVTISLINIIDSYCIDLLSCALLMLLTEYILNEFNFENKKNNTYKFVFISILFGFTFLAKLSNAPFLLLLFGFFVFKNMKSIKNFKVKDYILAILSFVFVVFIYVFYTYKMTGNPCFPFYNTIFKSNFYPLSNWMDTRFGPHRTLEAIIWPFIIVFNPIRAIDIGLVEPMWAIGYLSALVVCLVAIVKSIKEKKINENFEFSLFTIFAYFIWSKYELGYIRYGLNIVVLGGICLAILLSYLKKKNFTFLLSLLALAGIWNFSYNAINYFSKGYFWVFNNTFNNKYYSYNLDRLFSKCEIDIDISKENSAWGIIYYNSGIVGLVNDDIDMLNLTYGATNDYTKKLLNEKLDSYDHIYSMVDTLDLQNYFAELNNAGYKILKTIGAYKTDFLKRPNDYIYVFEISKCDDDENCFSSIGNFNTETSFDNESISIGLGENMGYLDTSNINVLFYDKNDKLINKINISGDGSFTDLKFNNSNEKKVVIADNDGNILEYPWMLLIKR